MNLKVSAISGARTKSPLCSQEADRNWVLIAACIGAITCVPSSSPADQMPHTCDIHEANGYTCQLLLVFPQETPPRPYLPVKTRAEINSLSPFWLPHLEHIWLISSANPGCKSLENVVFTFPVSMEEAFPLEGGWDGWLAPFHHRPYHHVGTGP